MSYKERFLKILQANDLFSYRCVSLSQINMQQKLEELCQIETVLLLETVNVANLSQEHQVCSRVLQECSFDTIFIEIIPLGKRKNLILKNILQDVQEKSLEVVKKTLVEDDKEKMSAEFKDCLLYLTYFRIAYAKLMAMPVSGLPAPRSPNHTATGTSMARTQRF